MIVPIGYGARELLMCRRCAAAHRMAQPLSPAAMVLVSQVRKSWRSPAIRVNMSQDWQLNYTANLQQEDLHANSRSESPPRG